MAIVLIIGASRGIGLATVDAALKAGYSVRALSRSTSTIRLHNPKLEKMDGDAIDRDTIERALVGVDTVIQTLGARAGVDPTRHSPCFPLPRRSLSARRRRTGSDA